MSMPSYCVVDHYIRLLRALRRALPRASVGSVEGDALGEEKVLLLEAGIEPLHANERRGVRGLRAHGAHEVIEIDAHAVEERRVARRSVPGVHAHVRAR